MTSYTHALEQDCNKSSNTKCNTTCYGGSSQTCTVNDCYKYPNDKCGSRQKKTCSEIDTSYRNSIGTNNCKVIEHTNAGGCGVTCYSGGVYCTTAKECKLKDNTCDNVSCNSGIMSSYAGHAANKTCDDGCSSGPRNLGYIMVSRPGLEPGTLCLKGRCSNQLS